MFTDIRVHPPFISSYILTLVRILEVLGPLLRLVSVSLSVCPSDWGKSIWSFRFLDFTSFFEESRGGMWVAEGDPTHPWTAGTRVWAGTCAAWIPPGSETRRSGQLRSNTNNQKRKPRLPLAAPQQQHAGVLSPRVVRSVLILFSVVHNLCFSEVSPEN